MHVTAADFRMPDLRDNVEGSGSELDEAWRSRIERELLDDDKGARAVCVSSRWDLVGAIVVSLGVRWMGASDATCTLCAVALVGYVLLETMNVWGRRMQCIGVGNRWLAEEAHSRNVHAIEAAGEAVVRRLERTVRASYDH